MRILMISISILGLASACGADLSIVNLHLEEYEDGPLYSLDHKFHPQEKVFLSFQIAGFQIKEAEDIRKIHLTYEISAVDPNRLALSPPQDGVIETTLAPEDKKWLPKIRYSLALPATPEPDISTIHISVTDQFSSKTITQEVPIEIVGPKGPRGQQFGLSSFRFLRSENEREAIGSEVSFRPGDTLWAKFNLTGYSFGPGNRYDVRYSIALLDSKEKVIFQEPKAAEEADESFYPKTTVNATMNLKLDPTIKPGGYTLVIGLTDVIASQTVEIRRSFLIEK